MKRIATILLALATVAVFSASAVAQQPLEYQVTVRGDVVKGTPSDHFVTLSTPFHVPNVTLPAGTYIFRILAPSLIQVSNLDRSEVYAMFFTAPVQRWDAIDEYEFTFVSRGEDAPPQLAKMFFADKSLGFELLYSADETRGAR